MPLLNPGSQVGVEAGPVVSNHEREAVLNDAETKGDVPRFRVFEGVADRFLRDEKKVAGDEVRDGQRGAVGFDGDADGQPERAVVGDALQRGLEAAAFERIGAKVEDIALHVLAAAGEELAGETEVVGAASRVLVAEILGGFELQRHAGERLRHRIVKVGGQAGALALRGLKVHLGIAAGADFLRELPAARRDEMPQDTDPDQREEQAEQRNREREDESRTGRERR